MTTIPESGVGAAALDVVLASELGVDPRYRHVSKRVAPGEPLVLPTSVLKWYSLAPPDRPVPESIAALARTRLTAAPLEARGLGFVILHRCGESFYFLLVCTWRNENELWKTVWYKDGAGMPDFAPFPDEGTHRPTFCVWELAPVWHEQQAWGRFLRTPRGRAEAEAWVRDTFAGEAEAAADERLTSPD